MPFRIIVVLIMLLGGGSLAWFALQTPSPSAAAAVAPPAMVKILVTNVPLQAGTLLKDADMREQEVEPSAVNENTFAADENARSEVRGAMLRRYLDVGQTILRPDILRPRDRGFLAAVLQPGPRAVSIGVDATTGASGLISPGDLVDVILTQEFARGDTPIGRRVVAETVLNMVRVIAVDQQIAQGAPNGTGLPNTNARVASNVSLQVTPEQAAKVVVASRLGKLTLLVRSIDNDQVGVTTIAQNPADTSNALKSTPSATPSAPPPPPSVFGSDVSAALSHDEPAVTPRLRLIQGDAVSDVMFNDGTKRP